MSFSSARPSSEAPSALHHAVGRLVVVECAFQRGALLHLLLQRPQLAHGVPVAIFVRDQNPADQRLVLLADHRNEDALEGDRRLELRQVEHPVQPPVALLDVDGLLEQDHQLGQRRRLHRKRVEILEVAQDLRQVTPLPPVEELVGVDRHHHVVVRPQLGFLVGRPRHDGAHQVAVDGLRDPVLAERHAEAAVHVVAREPPAADVEPHRRNRLRAVQVVEPEMQLLLVLVSSTRWVWSRRQRTDR